MVDPIDDVTQSLPVTVPCPIRIAFASPERLYSLVLDQDLSEESFVAKSLRDRFSNQSGG